MGSPEGLRVVPNTTEYFPGGVKVTSIIEKMREEVTEPSETSKHEADHIVTAEGNGTHVIMATIIPGPGYRGLTKLARPDAIAAAAPNSKGRSGTRHDMSIVATLGYPIEATRAVARRMVEANQPEIKAVAKVLEKKKTIYNVDIKSAIANARKEPRINATLFITKPDGSEERLIKPLESGKIAVSGDLIAFPKKSEPEVEDVKLAA